MNFQRFFLIQISIVLLVTLSACNESQGMYDYFKREIETPITTIEDGIPVATNRLLEWGSEAVLRNISVSFEGQDQIRDRKGKIRYVYAVKGNDPKEQRYADASVVIDMLSNSIRQVGISYDPRTKRGLFEKHYEPDLKDLNTENWNISIDDIFDLAMDQFSEESFKRFPNLYVKMSCYEDYWYLEIFTRKNKIQEEYFIQVNAKTKRIMDQWSSGRL